MKEYRRKHPSFSLCGLNCCLCPRFHTEGSSRCPGCGGPDFTAKHPSCSVITCSKKHDNVEFCFQCSAYPCKKYEAASQVDSFISYMNVLQDQAEAKTNLNNYLANLQKKHDILLELLTNYNDGKSKGFYCLAVNLLPLPALNAIMDDIKNIDRLSNKDRAKEITKLFKDKASSLNIELILRK